MKKRDFFVHNLPDNKLKFSVSSSVASVAHISA
jgi:hypothetical protein